MLEFYIRSRMCDFYTIARCLLQQITVNRHGLKAKLKFDFCNKSCLGLQAYCSHHCLTTRNKRCSDCCTDLSAQLTMSLCYLTNGLESSKYKPCAFTHAVRRLRKLLTDLPFVLSQIICKATLAQPHYHSGFVSLKVHSRLLAAVSASTNSGKCSPTPSHSVFGRFQSNPIDFASA